EGRPAPGRPGSAICAEPVLPRSDGETMVGAGGNSCGSPFCNRLHTGGREAHVDSRTTSSAGSVAVMTTPVLRCSIRVVARIRPASGPFWLTLVSGGLVLRATFESSYPTIATS